jgi:hypothetical protein
MLIHTHQPKTEADTTWKKTVQESKAKKSPVWLSGKEKTKYQNKKLCYWAYDLQMVKGSTVWQLLQLLPEVMMITHQNVLRFLQNLQARHVGLTKLINDLKLHPIDGLSEYYCYWKEPGAV